MNHAKPIVVFEIIQTEKQNIYEPKQIFIEQDEAMSSAKSSCLSLPLSTEKYPNERPKFKHLEEDSIFRKQRIEKQLDTYQFQKTFRGNVISVPNLDPSITRTETEHFLGCFKESDVNSEVEVKEQKNPRQSCKDVCEKSAMSSELSSISNISTEEKNTEETKTLEQATIFPTRRVEWQLHTYQFQKIFGGSAVLDSNLDLLTTNSRTESFLSVSKESFKNSETKEQLNEYQPADAFSGESNFGVHLSSIPNIIPNEESIEETEPHFNFLPNYSQRGIKGKHRISKNRSARGIHKMYKCCFCYFVTTRSDRLARHKIFIHSKESCYECYICKFRSTYNHEYYLHMKQHFGNSPYMCPLCSYTTRIISSFVTHRVTHTNHLIFQCQQCAYKCKRKHHLTQHAIVHTREAPFQCTYCEKRYKYNCSLKKHLLTHVKKG